MEVPSRAGARDSDLRPVSGLTETPIGAEEDGHLGDFIEDKAVEAPADAAFLKLLREAWRMSSPRFPSVNRKFCGCGTAR